VPLLLIHGDDDQLVPIDDSASCPLSSLCWAAAITSMETETCRTRQADPPRRGRQPAGCCGVTLSATHRGAMKITPCEHRTADLSRVPPGLSRLSANWPKI